MNENVPHHSNILALIHSPRPCNILQCWGWVACVGGKVWRVLRTPRHQQISCDSHHVSKGEMRILQESSSELALKYEAPSNHNSSTILGSPKLEALRCKTQHCCAADIIGSRLPRISIPLCFCSLPLLSHSLVTT